MDSIPISWLYAPSVIGRVHGGPATGSRRARQLEADEVRELEGRHVAGAGRLMPRASAPRSRAPRSAFRAAHAGRA